MTNAYIQKNDERGVLTVFDSSTIPFISKRIFFIDSVPVNTIRGFHAHIKCKQYLILLSGELLVSFYNTKKDEWIDYIMNNRFDSVYIPELTFAKQLVVSDQTSYLVLASELYDAADYINSLEEYAGFF